MTGDFQGVCEQADPPMLPFKRRDGTKIGTGELGREEAVKSPRKHTNQGENTGSQRKIKQRQKDGLRVTCSDSDEVTLATGQTKPLLVCILCRALCRHYF